MPCPPPAPKLKEPKARMCPKARELHSKHKKQIKTLKSQVDKLRSTVSRNRRDDAKSLRVLRMGHKKYAKEQRKRAMDAKEMMTTALKPDPQATQAYRQYYE